MMPQSKLQQVVNSIYRMALTLLYFTMVRLTSWGSRKFTDPLLIKKSPPSAKKRQLWLPRTTTDVKLDDARRQY